VLPGTGRKQDGRREGGAPDDPDGLLAVAVNVNTPHDAGHEYDGYALEGWRDRIMDDS
jgi:hypothetical protein